MNENCVCHIRNLDPPPFPDDERFYKEVEDAWMKGYNKILKEVTSGSYVICSHEDAEVGMGITVNGKTYITGLRRR